MRALVRNCLLFDAIYTAVVYVISWCWGPDRRLCCVRQGDGDGAAEQETTVVEDGANNDNRVRLVVVAVVVIVDDVVDGGVVVVLFVLLRWNTKYAFFYLYYMWIQNEGNLVCLKSYLCATQLAMITRGSYFTPSTHKVKETHKTAPGWIKWEGGRVENDERMSEP